MHNGYNVHHLYIHLGSCKISNASVQSSIIKTDIGGTYINNIAKVCGIPFLYQSYQKPQCNLANYMLSKKTGEHHLHR